MPAGLDRLAGSRCGLSGPRSTVIVPRHRAKTIVTNNAGRVPRCSADRRAVECEFDGVVEAQFGARHMRFAPSGVAVALAGRTEELTLEVGQYVGVADEAVGGRRAE